MFEQLRDLNNLSKQANELQKTLEAERITISSANGLVKLTLNGAHELIDLKINSDLANITSETLISAFKQAYNQAQSELKTTLARKFQGLI